MIFGAATAAVAGHISHHEMNMFIAMVLGMAAGMAVTTIIGFPLAMLAGMFETMIPGMFIGMYGGMYYAMQKPPKDMMEMLTRGFFLGIVGWAVMLGYRLYYRNKPYNRIGDR